MTSHLVEWTPEDFLGVEENILAAQHDLHQTGLFDDEGLIKIFDTHPRRRNGHQYDGRIEYDVRMARWRS